MTTKSLRFESLPQLAIAEGATSPDPGTPGVLAWSTTLTSLVLWDGSNWSSFSGGGSSSMRQYVVEFIRGVGIVTNGVVDATDTTGPFSWDVPDDVVELIMDACGAGQSGTGGAAEPGGTISSGGGAGGANAAAVKGARVSVYPGSTLTVTVPLGGAATAAGEGWNGGSHVLIEGIRSTNLANTGTDVFHLVGSSNEYPGGTPTSSTSGQGTGTDGQTGEGNNESYAEMNQNALLDGVYQRPGRGPQGGAGADGDGSVAGFNGGEHNGFTGVYGQITNIWEVGRALGTTTGTISRGGGGNGAPSLFGRGGRGGSGGPGEDSPSFGAGGGGGSGGFGSGKGGDGYVRFTYFSAI